MKLFVLVLAGIAQQATPLQLLNAGGGRGAGLLLPRALNERQQSQMYAYVCANARGTQEWQNLQLDAGTLACDERDMRVPASLNSARASLFDCMQVQDALPCRTATPAVGAQAPLHAQVKRRGAAEHLIGPANWPVRCKGKWHPWMRRACRGTKSAPPRACRRRAWIRWCRSSTAPRYARPPSTMGSRLGQPWALAPRAGPDAATRSSNSVGRRAVRGFGSVEHEVVSARPAATGPAWWRRLPQHRACWRDAPPAARVAYGSPGAGEAAHVIRLTRPPCSSPASSVTMAP